jgi:hypothetical protein
MRQIYAILFLSLTLQARASDFLLQQAANIPARRGMAAYFPFYDGAKDFSGYGCDATLTNAVVSNRCLVISGIGGMRYTADNSSTALTVAAWFRTTNTADSVLITKYKSDSDQRCFAGQFSGGKFGAVVASGTTTIKYYQATNLLCDGEWHHVAFTFAPYLLKIYIDGSPITATNILVENAVAALGTGATVVTSVGHTYYSTPSAFNGLIADIVQYNRTYTDEGIRDLKLKGPP